MKLRWYDRILVALGGLVLIAIGGFAILSASGLMLKIWPAMPRELILDTWLGTGWQWMPLVILGGAVMVIWGLWLVIRPFRREKEGRGKYYTLQNEQDGNVRISVHAIDHLVRRCIEAYAQVISAKIKITGSEDAMHIILHLTLRTDVRIPELVTELREDIKRSLDHSAGVVVETVEIYVEATKDDKNSKDDIRYLEAPASAPAPAPRREEAAVEPEPVDTASFYSAPVVVTEEPKQPEPITANEPTVRELEKEIDFGPDEPMPVDLSAQAFPFPEEAAGVPLEIYTHDVPIEDEAEDEEARKEDEDDV